jgi:7-carboxy-7-deazaguanine synthase
MKFELNKILPINELYVAVQAEGSRFGMPTIVIRTTGCTHRCWFGEGGWCDAWRNSIHPEKGSYTFQDVIDIYDKNTHIREMMITGGSPTMHFDVVNELNNFARSRGIVVTIETEGSHFIKTDYPIDLVSLSPKFSNSIPKLGIKTPLGNTVDQRFIDTHNRLRLNYTAINEMLDYHYDYHYKPVWDGTDENLQEIEEFRVKMHIPKHKTWVMPAGDTRDELIKMYPIVLEMCAREGYNFSGRDHIIAYDTKRCV